MEGHIHRTLVWIESRTGLQSACSRFLLEDIPASAGWPQVFGSVSLFLFLTQSLTGILLAFNYAPTPGDAYNSVTYLVRNVAAGRMIHGLHHWGASLMVVTVCLHMAQVFVYGAYKKPREATWAAGVLLLLLVLAFGLTGYLLPWDNRAYWGTIVTTRIMGSLPLAGPLLTRLMGASNGIGVLTFSRFYTLHSVLLPAATVILIIVHVYLVRRHGITPAASDRGDKQKFYPKQVFRDVLAVFVAFAVLFAAAALVDVPLERLADPTDTTYVPRPEWYFLFLFQMLKLFKGPFEVIGTAVLPTLAVGLLFLLPFVRLSRWRILDRRAVSIAIVLLTVGGWAALTTAALSNSPGSKRQSLSPHEAMEWAHISPEEIAGIGYFRSLRCDSCHNLLTGDPKPGPNLASIDLHHSKEWLAQHFRHDGRDEPEASTGTNANVSPSGLSLSRLNALSLFIAGLKSDSATALQSMSPDFILGAQTFVVGACASCHKVNGTGGGVGPALNGLADRRTEQWVRAHFTAPQRLSPGSIMPPYRFSRAEEDALVLYLFSLPN